MKLGSTIGKFEIKQFNEERKKIELRCVSTVPEGDEMMGWKLKSLAKNMKIAKMTLSSHPGQALVRHERV